MELQQKESGLDSLASRYARLSPDPDSQLAHTQLVPLRHAWCTLLDDLDTVLEERRRLLATCQSYRQQQIAAEAGVTDVTVRVEQAVTRRQPDDRIRALQVNDLFYCVSDIFTIHIIQKIATRLKS